LRTTTPEPECRVAFVMAQHQDHDSRFAFLEEDVVGKAVQRSASEPTLHVMEMPRIGTDLTNHGFNFGEKAVAKLPSTLRVVVADR
jgi:hypothetical protein